MSLTPRERNRGQNDKDSFKNSGYNSMKMRRPRRLSSEIEPEENQIVQALFEKLDVAATATNI